MSIGSGIVMKSVRHHKAVTLIVVLGTVAIALAAALPSIWPGTFGFLNAVKVDTDPENMLSEREPVRLFHNAMKKKLSLHDMVVVGIVNESDPNGVFNAASLRKAYELTEFAKGLRGAAIGQPAGSSEGVIEVDVIAPSTVDSIEPGADGVSFSWLMPSPPADDKAALEVWRKARRIPFLLGTVLGDKEPQRPAKALAMYLPLTRKDLSHRVYLALQKKTAELGGPEEFHITGLPVAEDTFGVEMFVQMAISAPAAMIVIFLLMLAFFRKLVLIVSPMIVALVSVVFTMGALVIAGFPVHIMSSMIPIFIMPIAVLDSIHIISEFFERYQATRDRRKTIQTVMDELYLPMLYTSLTSAAGFASLALTPIPPVQVFGMFVAAGIMVAWVLTVTFVPAYVMFISPKTLEGFGAKHAATEEAEDRTLMGRALRWLAGATYRRAKLILAVSLVVLAVAGYGISRININDNPVKWFTPSHPIRRADTVLNRHFGGTYMAYLAMESQEPPFDAKAFAEALAGRARARGAAIATALGRVGPAAGPLAADANSAEDFFARLTRALRPARFAATDEQLAVWRYVDGFLGLEASAPAGGFDAKQTAAGLDAKAKAHAARIAVLLGKLDGWARDVAAAKPPSAEAMLALLAQKARRERTGKAPRAGEAEETPKSAPSAGNDEPPLPATDGEPALPGIGPASTKPATTQPKPADRYADAALTELEVFLDEQRQLGEVFKRPDVLAWMIRLQERMKRTGIVGKSNSLADMVATVHRDLLSGTEKDYRLPANRATVGQCLIQFQNSHRPHDLWHFVTPDYRLSSVWVQLTSGDNRDMQRVVRAVDEFVAKDHAPVPIRARWFGLTYINVEWQDKMVTGMLEAFAGSFLVVLLLMVILFRSVLWGLLSMIPLTVTIAAIYGVVGLAGKDYDMPVAVLSSLTLGLAVDFSIHFLARSRAMYAVGETTWRATVANVFGEPARAITRNIIVIAAGFLPLLLAPLVPYKTVGVLLAVILLVSGFATLLILPALIRLLERRLFATFRTPMRASCNCGLCIVTAGTLVAVLVMAVKPYVPWEWTTLTWVAAPVVPLAALACGLLSRRQKCKLTEQGETK